MAKILIDVMIENDTKCYCSLIYNHSPLFKLNMDDIIAFVLDKRPTLRYRKDVHLFLNSKK